MFNLNLFKQKNISKKQWTDQRNKVRRRVRLHSCHQRWSCGYNAEVVERFRRFWPRHAWCLGMPWPCACCSSSNSKVQVCEVGPCQATHIILYIYIRIYIYILYMNMIYAHYHTYFILLAVIFPICSNVFSTLVIVHPVEWGPIVL